MSSIKLKVFQITNKKVETILDDAVYALENN